VIKHAAIKKDGIVYVGKRHCDCIETMMKCGLSWPVTKGAVQGFVDDTGRFLDRVEALAVATACNQIIKKTAPHDVLFSEDIY
jgi:hypothetical protein